VHSSIIYSQEDIRQRVRAKKPRLPTQLRSHLVVRGRRLVFSVSGQLHLAKDKTLPKFCASRPVEHPSAAHASPCTTLVLNRTCLPRSSRLSCTPQRWEYVRELELQDAVKTKLDVFGLMQNGKYSLIGHAENLTQAKNQARNYMLAHPRDALISFRIIIPTDSLRSFLHPGRGTNHTSNSQKQCIPE
jgi:hypothetical protein